MTGLRIAPIVEGHGEVAAVRTLLEGIWRWLGGDYVDVLRAVRRPRSKFVRPRGQNRTVPDREELVRAITFASKKLLARTEPPLPSLVLVLLDSDVDCPKDLAPEIMRIAQEAAPGQDVACILANIEYETWFVAAAESLSDFITLSVGDSVPNDPEGASCGKGWVQNRFKGAKYSETVDQVRMTARMDLALCRQRSPSFDKLCRELESRLRREVTKSLSG